METSDREILSVTIEENKMATLTKLQEAVKTELIAGMTKEEILYQVKGMIDSYRMVQNFKATTKVCKTCNEIHPVSEFSKRKQNKDGLNASCKSCDKKWRDEYKANKAAAKAKLESYQNDSLV